MVKAADDQKLTTERLVIGRYYLFPFFLKIFEKGITQAGVYIRVHLCYFSFLFVGSFLPFEVVRAGGGKRD